MVQYVSGKVCEYGSRHQLAISATNWTAWPKMVDELTGFGRWRSSCAIGVSEILVNRPGRGVRRAGRGGSTRATCASSTTTVRAGHSVSSRPSADAWTSPARWSTRACRTAGRVNAIIPRWRWTGPCISIRKFSRELLRSADLLAYQSVDEALLEFLRQAVSRRCSILISGGTGTGKTTLLNVISGFIDERERIVTIEDTAELQLGHDHGGAPGDPSAERRGATAR
ncbi:ATPase, T2SS/T4P/T4SS family [Pseudomonas aeruginosa]